jgi:streptogramin lyase
MFERLLPACVIALSLLLTSCGGNGGGGGGTKKGGSGGTDPDPVSEPLGIFYTMGVSGEPNGSYLQRMDDMSGTDLTALPGYADNLRPRSVAFDLDFHIYVTDLTNDKIYRYDDFDGSGKIELDGNPGSMAPLFLEPVGIAVDEQNRIYIADAQYGLVRFDNMTGAGRLTYNAMVNKPTSVHIDADGRILLCDRIGSRIVRINDMTGAGFTALGSAGDRVGEFFLPEDVTTDTTGHIYIADSGNSRVVRIDDMSGAGWITRGAYSGHTFKPTSIDIDSDDRIYFFDRDHDRIVRINDIQGTGWKTHSIGASNTPLQVRVMDVWVGIN